MVRDKSCLALFSGGLDSILAVKVMEKLGYRVKSYFFRTPFFEADSAQAAAEKNAIDLKVVDVFDQYIEVLTSPRYGYGKNMNPCIDCHGFMFRMAAERLKADKADFLISGEVLGQRPKSQRKDAMNAVAKLSGMRDLIIRPLSQRLLKDTLPIREGWVDKTEMLDIQGRGRHRQLELAKEFGVNEFNTPGGGCKLTDIKFSVRLKDLIEHGQLTERNIEFLKYGRHFRLSETTKLVVGRNKSDNDQMTRLAEEEIVLKTAEFQGPLGIVISKEELSEDELLLAARILLRYNNKLENLGKVNWGKKFSLINTVEIEKYPPEAVQAVMIK